MLKSLNYVFCLLILLSCAGKESLKTAKIFAEPKYTLSAIRFIDVDMERLRLEVDLDVENPNYISLEFKNVNYVLNIDGAQVLSGALEDNLLVPAKGQFTVTIPLQVKLESLANGAVSLLLKRKIEYEFSAKLNSTIPILEKKTFTIVKANELSF